MANTQAVNWSMVLKVVETIDTSTGAAEFLVVTTDPDQTHQIDGLSGSLSATTTPAAAKAWSSRVALSSGAITVDLAALTGQAGTSVDMSGLELIAMTLKPNGANSMTFADGASNGYPLYGDTSGQVTIPTGGSNMFYTADGIGQVVDGTHKTIDVTGTGVETFDIVVVFG